MNKFNNVKIVAFDLDGTLTQHKEKLTDENKLILDNLAKKYKVLVVGAGQCIYTFGKYIRNMHAKDGLPPTDSRRIGKEVEIGKGYVDFKKVIKHLKQVNYDRYIIIEREITGEKQITDILNAVKYLKTLWNDTCIEEFN